MVVVQKITQAKIISTQSANQNIKYLIHICNQIIKKKIINKKFLLFFIIYI